MGTGRAKPLKKSPGNHFPEATYLSTKLYSCRMQITGSLGHVPSIQLFFFFKGTARYPAVTRIQGYRLLYYSIWRYHFREEKTGANECMNVS
jgi:hypothetical protein